MKRKLKTVKNDQLTSRQDGMKTEKNIYTGSAYRSDCVKQMPRTNNLFPCEDNWNNRLKKEFTKYLPWGNFLGLESSIAMKINERGKKFSLGALPIMCNHKNIYYSNISILRVALIYLVCMYFAFEISYPFMKVYGNFTAPFMLLVFISVSLMTLLAIVVSSYVKFQFEITINREQGSINFRKRFGKKINFSFVECDALINIEHNRNHGYRLVLRSRYQKKIVVLAGRMASVGPMYMYWQFVQRFMDVTQPLPDIPAIEPYRHLDPVTAEYDKRINRPERYWRDKSKEEIQEIACKLEREEAGIVPIVPCQMAPYIEGRNPNNLAFGHDYIPPPVPGNYSEQ